MNGSEIASLFDEGLQHIIAKCEKANGPVPLK